MVNKKWVTIKEAASITGLSIPTIKRRIKSGMWEAKQESSYRKWYILYTDLPTFLRNEEEE